VLWNGSPDFETDPREYFPYLEATEENSEREIFGTDYDLDVVELKLYYVNERRFRKCPHVKLQVGGQPTHVIAFVDSCPEASILAQELFNKLTTSNIEMLRIPITGAVLISAWGNRTKKIKTQALVPFEMSGGYFEHNCNIAPGVIAYCTLGAEVLDNFQVTISFEKQCMYSKDEIGSRRHQFVNEGMSKDEPKEEAPIRGVSNSTTGVDKREPSCNNERNLGILASDIAYDDRSFPLTDGDDSIEKGSCCLQHTTVCAKVQLQWTLELNMPRNFSETLDSLAVCRLSKKLSYLTFFHGIRNSSRLNQADVICSNMNLRSHRESR